jgi:asparagine synthase (glutamine-hydrolysing)
MCGIYGIYQRDGSPADAGLLTRMGDVIIHRGPDDSGFMADGSCAIGMRRLSIIDLAGGHQPIRSADGRFTIVCNGEIYNYRELRSELIAAGQVFKTHSDSEVLLLGYAEWGEAVLERLNGMYGFAIWDARSRSLLVGRDRLGIKPIYYLDTGRRIAFASEAKALLELPGVERDIDPAALRSYLELGYVPAPLCMLKGIRKLPIGGLLRVDAAGVTVRNTWMPPTAVDESVSEADWITNVRSRIERSVQMQMVSDVPIGAFLSGGIDSSTVLAFMSRASDRPVRTYSIGFEGGAAERFYNELDNARQIAQLFKTDHHEILVRPDVVSLLPRLLWHMDEPIADSAFVTTYLVAQFARKDVKVILSGVGGDELFGGYRRYMGEQYMRYLNWMPDFALGAAVRAAAWLPTDRHSKWLNYTRLARNFIESSQLPFTERYRAYVGVFSPAEAQGLQRAGGRDRFDALGAAFDAVGGEDTLARMFAADALTQLPDDLLLLTDKMTMATSLECRVPLLDHELVELAARIPAGIKVAGGEMKALMKKALADVLPREVLNRPKRGFGAPMGAWLKNELAALLSGALSLESIERRGLLHPEPIARLIDAHRTNRIDGTDRLLALLNLEVWSRVYLDRRPSEDVAGELAEAAA